MTQRWQGLKISDAGELQISVAAALGSFKAFSGIATDSDGVAYASTTAQQPKALTKSGAFTTLLDGSLYTTTATPGAAGDYKWNGLRFDVTGALYTTTGAAQAAGDFMWNSMRVSAAGAVYISGGGVTPIFSATLQSTLVPSIYGGSSTPTFTRGSTAYDNGYLTTIAAGNSLIAVASGEARFTGARRTAQDTWFTTDSNVVALTTGNGASNVVTDASGPFGYLSEAAATNLCLQSQTLATTWTAGGVSVVSDAAVAPDGTTTADKILSSTSPVHHRIYQTLTITANATYTISWYLKYIDNQYVAITASDSTAYRFYAVADLVGGTITDTGVAVAAGGAAYIGSSITALPNSWYRVTVTGTVTTGDTTIYPVAVLNQTSTGVSNTYVGTSKSAHLWGAQTELGMVATSYIPTTTVAVTRSVDADQYVSASNLATTSTIALDWFPEGAASMGTVFLFGTYVDASNYTAILHDGTNIIARKRIAGANHDATKALSYAANTKYRIVARFNTTDGIDIWVAGVKGTNDATTTAAQVGTNFQVGADGNGANQAQGSVRNFAIYPNTTDAQAAAL